MNIYQEHSKNQKTLKKIIRACQHLLLTSDHAKKAKEYLNTRLNQDNQLLWNFGFFPKDKDLKDLTSMVSKEELEVMNLYYPKFLGDTAPHGHFSEHNLILPFHNVHGDVVSILGRCLLSEEDRQDNMIPKYKYSTGCQKELYVYGLDKAKSEIIKNDFVIGVEGQFDCIAMHAQGIKNTVAFGWANLSRYQLFQLLRYTNNIILMFDNDEAGYKAKKRIKDRYKNDANIKLVSPPVGFKDIDEFFRNTKDKIYISFVIDTMKGFGEMNGKKI